LLAVNRAESPKQMVAGLTVTVGVNTGCIGTTPAFV